MKRVKQLAALVLTAALLLSISTIAAFASDEGNPSASASLDPSAGSSDPVSEDITVYWDIPYSDDGNEQKTLDLYLPEEENFPTLIYFHGGGFSSGDKSETHALGEYLVRHGIALVSVNYSVGRDVRYPVFIQDAAESVAWTMEHMSEYGHCDQFYVGGSSAGAYLSLMLCFDKEYLEAYGIEPTDIAGYIHDSGQPTTHFAILSARGMNSDRVVVDEAAPLYYVGTEKEYAPMMILVATEDLGVRYDQTMLLVSTMKLFGVPEENITLKVMEGGHCEHTFAKDENGESVMGKLCADYILNGE